jgi:cytochrome P450
LLLTTSERLVEVFLLVLVVLPLTRLAFDPGIRRRFKAFPPIQPLLPIALATYAIGIVAALVFAPIVLRPAAAVAAGLIVYELLQRRPGFGDRRKLPPGSLTYFPIEPWRDPEYFRKSAARWGPAFKFRHLSRPAVAIVGLDHIGGFLQSHSAELSSPPAPFNTILPGGFVRYLNGDDHLDTAVMLRSAMSRTVLEQCSDDVTAEARNTVEVIARNPQKCEQAVDEMMLHVMMRCFLGLGRGAERDRFAELFRTADYRRLARTGRVKARQAIGEIIREMRILSTRENVQGSFLLELAKAHPQALASDAMMGSFAYALHTARVDASGLLTWMIAVLGEHPQWAATLRAEYSSSPAAGETGGLADRIVRETLRLRQSEFIIRRARSDIDWNGFTIPEGWHVRLCVAESHRSSDAFVQPDRFDPGRFLKTPTRARYAPFGFAPHLCPGEHLTRWIGRKLLVELARGHDIRASGVVPWEFGGFHWRPNREMKITLTPVQS